MTKLGWTLVGLAAVVGVVVVVKRSEKETSGGGALGPSGGTAPGRELEGSVTTARVLETVNTRTEPRADAPKVAANDARKGSIVKVLETGIPSRDAASREWWRIVTPGGSEGFASAVGSRGERNLEIATLDLA